MDPAVGLPGVVWSPVSKNYSQRMTARQIAAFPSLVSSVNVADVGPDYQQGASVYRVKPQPLPVR